jgi:hypothetical protein
MYFSLYGGVVDYAKIEIWWVSHGGNGVSDEPRPRKQEYPMDK